MKKSDVPRMPSYFDTYIDKVADISLADALQQSLHTLETLDWDQLNALADRVYAPGKWTTCDIFQHLIDTERVFAYRTLRFARRDKTLLPGFDENSFAEHAHAGRRPLDLILSELKLLRQVNQLMFASFSDEDLRQSGVMFQSEISVLAAGFCVVGHQIHHLQILAERYFPLLHAPK